MPSPANPVGIISPQKLLEQLRWRYAVKKFDPARKISKEIWNTLEQALVLSPSSYGLQPWKFIIINDPALRQRLQPASWNQSQIVDASHLVVFAEKRNLSAADIQRHVERIAAVRKVPPESLNGYKQMMMGGLVDSAAKGFDINCWSSRQVYLALGIFLTSAAVLGIDACPMEGIEPERYDEILGLNKTGYHTLCVAAAGTRAADDAYARAPKVRFPVEEVVDRR